MTITAGHRTEIQWEMPHITVKRIDCPSMTHACSYASSHTANSTITAQPREVVYNEREKVGG
jgi:hypothetical protein